MSAVTEAIVCGKKEAGGVDTVWAGTQKWGRRTEQELHKSSAGGLVYLKVCVCVCTDSQHIWSLIMVEQGGGGLTCHRLHFYPTPLNCCHPHSFQPIPSSTQLMLPRTHHISWHMDQSFPPQLYSFRFISHFFTSLVCYGSTGFGHSSSHLVIYWSTRALTQCLPVTGAQRSLPKCQLELGTE